MLRIALALITAALCTGPATAGFTIAEYTGPASGTSVSTFAIGQSFTTSTGGPWDQITFNFFAPGGATTPVASGTLYLLDKEYFGKPVDLSASTPGFLATGAATAAGVYVFDSGVTLQAQTQYFVYTSAAFGSSIAVRLPGDYDGGKEYTTSPNSNYSAIFGGQVDALFRVQGELAGPTPMAAPEPASLTLGLLGVGGLLALRRRLA
ncbi:hypothetical protein J8F10_16000 [Gemmata sp. G18]|uniref:PEP-CTERM sorting domain-containing protein n=1 Tax=Gemmata palustris TaxID=2822762 RepID=A0ABS5BSS3_9BACT|nr:PEP-CTERM sorting domain-containing protein [Gemmata palustris]MBP3956776.1 hypothetical protein [Gemmata palustris]